MKSFNKHILTAALLLLLSPAFAQVQKGYVRTVGRPDNREGERISDITIRVAGLHNPFVSKADGTFDFNLGGGKTIYTFTSILDSKFQYELQEKELLGREEPVSTTVTKEIVMVSLKEKQAIENKKREQIERQYQRDLKRLEAQRKQNEITIEKYREELQALHEAFDKRDMLITDLTEHFASIDYAKLSEEQARISALLEDGDLLTADSILNAKGDVPKRVKELLAFRAENTAQQEILNKKIEDERAGTADLMQDCESKFLIFEQQHKNDTAAYYLELLVSLDTANVENLNRTGKFIYGYLAKYDKALEYFYRALRNAQKQYGEEHPDVANTFVLVHMTYDLAERNKVNAQELKEMLPRMAYTLTCIEGDTPAQKQGMSGEYFVLKFEEWAIKNETSLLSKNNELRGKPKTIVVMKDGVISEHSFEDSIGAQISCKYVGKEEKQRMIDAYNKWGKSRK